MKPNFGSISCNGHLSSDVWWYYDTKPAYQAKRLLYARFGVVNAGGVGVGVGVGVVVVGGLGVVVGLGVLVGLSGRFPSRRLRHAS
jgi:hypothetical protein